jgi:hypothetical protein
MCTDYCFRVLKFHVLLVGGFFFTYTFLHTTEKGKHAYTKSEKLILLNSDTTVGIPNALHVIR